MCLSAFATRKSIVIGPKTMSTKNIVPRFCTTLFELYREKLRKIKVEELKDIHSIELVIKWGRHVIEIEEEEDLLRREDIELSDVLEEGEKHHCIGGKSNVEERDANDDLEGVDEGPEHVHGGGTKGQGEEEVQDEV